MVRDYFSVYSKNDEAFLLRIHQKVDFADEIAWAHCWFCPRSQFATLIVPFIADYLHWGFDVIENWDNIDQKGWHESVKHLGFRKELVEMELVPDIILGTSSLSEQIEKRLSGTDDQGQDITIPTYVGALCKAFKEKGMKVPNPRDGEAVINVLTKDIRKRNWFELISAMEAFC